MTNRYDKKTIKKACTLYTRGVPLREIMRQTGIKSTSTIQFQCDPAYREAHMKRSKAWREKNPEKWKEINTRAVRNYQKKKNDSHGKK